MNHRQIYVFMIRSLFCLIVLGFLFAFGLGFERFSSESQEPPAETKLQTGPGIGQRIPNFQVIDQNGRQETFGSIRGPRGALIVFYRSADW
jgi:cytochrome oxidase Cu insertion factor (SCO1/SenC/PrrC family)